MNQTKACHFYSLFFIVVVLVSQDVLGRGFPLQYSAASNNCQQINMRCISGENFQTNYSTLEIIFFCFLFSFSKYPEPKTNFHHELISSKDTETIEVDISKMNFDQYLAYLEKKAQMKRAVEEAEGIERKKKLSRMQRQNDVSTYVTGGLLGLGLAVVFCSSVC
jgi:hypothetical protein